MPRTRISLDTDAWFLGEGDDDVEVPDFIELARNSPAFKRLASYHPASIGLQFSNELDAQWRRRGTHEGTLTLNAEMPTTDDFSTPEDRFEQAWRVYVNYHSTMVYYQGLLQRNRGIIPPLFNKPLFRNTSLRKLLEYAEASADGTHWGDFERVIDQAYITQMSQWNVTLHMCATIPRGYNDAMLGEFGLPPRPAGSNTRQYARFIMDEDRTYPAPNAVGLTSGRRAPTRWARTQQAVSTIRRMRTRSAYTVPDVSRVLWARPALRLATARNEHDRLVERSFEQTTDMTYRQQASRAYAQGFYLRRRYGAPLTNGLFTTHEYEIRPDEGCCNGLIRHCLGESKAVYGDQAMTVLELVQVFTDAHRPIVVYICTGDITEVNAVKAHRKNVHVLAHAEHVYLVDKLKARCPVKLVDEVPFPCMVHDFGYSAYVRTLDSFSLRKKPDDTELKKFKGYILPTHYDMFKASHIRLSPYYDAYDEQPPRRSVCGFDLNKAHAHILLNREYVFPKPTLKATIRPHHADDIIHPSWFYYVEPTHHFLIAPYTGWHYGALVELYPQYFTKILYSFQCGEECGLPSESADIPDLSALYVALGRESMGESVFETFYDVPRRFADERASVQLMLESRGHHCVANATGINISDTRDRISTACLTQFAVYAYMRHEMFVYMTQILGRYPDAHVSEVKADSMYFDAEIDFTQFRMCRKSPARGFKRIPPKVAEKCQVCMKCIDKPPPRACHFEADKYCLPECLLTRIHELTGGRAKPARVRRADTTHYDDDDSDDDDWSLKSAVCSSDSDNHVPDYTAEEVEDLIMRGIVRVTTAEHAMCDLNLLYMPRRHEGMFRKSHWIVTEQMYAHIMDPENLMCGPVRPLQSDEDDSDSDDEDDYHNHAYDEFYDIEDISELFHWAEEYPDDWLTLREDSKPEVCEQCNGTGYWIRGQRPSDYDECDYGRGDHRHGEDIYLRGAQLVAWQDVHCGWYPPDPHRWSPRDSDKIPTSPEDTPMRVSTTDGSYKYYVDHAMGFLLSGLAGLGKTYLIQHSVIPYLEEVKIPYVLTSATLANAKMIGGVTIQRFLRRPNEHLKTQKLTYVICDEATQLTQIQLMRMHSMRFADHFHERYRFILIADENQCGPVDSRIPWVCHDVGRSLVDYNQFAQQWHSKCRFTRELNDALNNFLETQDLSPFRHGLMTDATKHLCWVHAGIKLLKKRGIVAQTIHSAQGDTIDEPYMIHMWDALVDTKQFNILYTALSRGRKLEHVILCDDSVKRRRTR